MLRLLIKTQNNGYWMFPDYDIEDIQVWAGNCRTPLLGINQSGEVVAPMKIDKPEPRVFIDNTERPRYQLYGNDIYDLRAWDALTEFFIERTRLFWINFLRI